MEKTPQSLANTAKEPNARRAKSPADPAYPFRIPMNCFIAGDSTLFFL